MFLKMLFEYQLTSQGVITQVSHCSHAHTCKVMSSWGGEGGGGIANICKNENRIAVRQVGS